MENVSTKIYYIIVDVIMFLLAILSAITLKWAAQKLLVTKQSATDDRSSVTTVKDDVEDSDKSVYMGRKDYRENSDMGDLSDVSLQGKDYISVNGNDVMTKAAVFNEIISIPGTDVQTVSINDVTYTETEIASIVSNGKTEDIWTTINRSTADSYKRTYVTDSDGKITALSYS
jgi:hypothetical protein